MNLTPEQVKHMVDTMTPEQIKSWVQQEAFSVWKAAGKRGSIESATGTGKSYIGLLAAHAELQLDPDALIYIAVPTENARDVTWPEEMRKWKMDHLVEKTRRICYVSLSKEVPEKDVSLFIGDEFHHCTLDNSSFFTDDRWKVFHILGLTATLPDKHGYESDRDKRALIDSLAPSIYKVTIEEAIALKLVSEFEVKIISFDLDNTDAYIVAGSAAKPFKQTEWARYQYLTKNLQRAMWNKKYPGMKFKAMQQRMDFIYNLRSKELLAKEIMEKILPDNRTLIFAGSIEQSVKLCGKQVYNSTTGSKELERFCAGEIDYLGVVEALNESANIPLLDQGLVVQIKSKELGIIQRIGRHIRWREGHVAQIIVLVAKGTVDEKWAESAFKNFDQSRIKKYYVKPEYRTKDKVAV
jgi:superfamily II DNA or RNA helicase